MSAYEDVVGGMLKLQGKALDVKAGGVKKKKKHAHHYDHGSQIENHEDPAGGSSGISADPTEDINEANKFRDGHPPAHDIHLTPAERRYIEQRAKIEMHRLAKNASKSS